MGPPIGLEPSMPALSRREFGTIVIAGVPFTVLSVPRGLSAAGSVAVGVSTSSFSDLAREVGRDNVDDIIRALKTVRATRGELAFANVEPAPPNTAPFMGGTPAYPARVTFSPEQIAAINAQSRFMLRSWRAQTEPKYFTDVRAKFADAGITLIAAALRYDDSFTDDEIEATFRQAKALGVSTISSPMTMATAARLVPFAARHQIAVAIHNQADGNTVGSIATPELTNALALSPSFKLKLDIGNLTASNRDAVAELRTHQARVSHVLVRDRLRNGGKSQHFGEGDTPIAAVLDVLKTASTPIPAVVEYDYVGLHSSVEEIATSVGYVTQAIR